MNTQQSFDAGRSFDAAQYQQNASFVPALGDVILGWLAPQPGEHILDLGAGDGVLTAKLVAAGMEVVAGSPKAYEGLIEVLAPHVPADLRPARA